MHGFFAGFDASQQRRHVRTRQGMNEVPVQHSHDAVEYFTGRRLPPSPSIVISDKTFAARSCILSSSISFLIWLVLHSQAAAVGSWIAMFQKVSNGLVQRIATGTEGTEYKMHYQPGH